MKKHQAKIHRADEGVNQATLVAGKKKRKKRTAIKR